MAIWRRSRGRAGYRAPDVTWLVVGLGNPGTKYARTRHNAGFTVVEQLAERAGSAPISKYDGLFSRASVRDQRVALLLPLTYMNRSGTSVQQALRDLGLSADRLLVVHDELDLPLGVVRVKSGGGLAGHNGLKSVSDSTHTRDFSRVRLGIGRPAPGERRPVADWVLDRFGPDEDEAGLYERGTRALEAVIAHGVQSAMNEVNSDAS